MEHDACGVGMIATFDGKKQEKLLTTGLKRSKLFGIEAQ